MSQSLITAPVYVQVPIIKVKIGDYQFGVYEKDKKSGYVRYPNYIQSLEVTKINGLVNKYTLNISYPLTNDNDPNYFEKIFASVSRTRRIEFIYGDASMPNYLYRNEVGMIQKVDSDFQLESSVISYTVYATSVSSLALSGGYNFPSTHNQPSMVILDILKNNAKYGLQDLFVGMRNLTLVDMHGLIPHNDLSVDISKQDNISALDYLNYLVALMTPNNKTNKTSFYILTIVDDTSDIFDGSYFKIVQVDTNIAHPEAYQLDIGYPGSNYVFGFKVNKNENFSILYEYQNKLHPQEYVSRINSDGEYEEVFAPTISSNTSDHATSEDNKTWWSKVTQFPIKATVTIRGLLRPALLMTYIRLNIILFGKKHINSGLYIITKQVDRIDGSGYRTTLDMQRLADDNE